MYLLGLFVLLFWMKKKTDGFVFYFYYKLGFVLGEIFILPIAI